MEAFPRTGGRDEIKGFVFTYRLDFVSTVKSNGEGGRRISVFPLNALIIRHGWCARWPFTRYLKEAAGVHQASPGRWWYNVPTSHHGAGF